MMARIVLLMILAGSMALPGICQMKGGGDISVDEKLGATVAMDVVLKDESGADVTLDQLIDRPTILIFNYFRCPGICPVLLNNVVDVVNRIALEPGVDFRLIAVSFDPVDTPQLAREKKANYLNQMRRQFPPQAWRFLTGTAANTRMVADSAGFNYQKRGDMYAHPGVLIVLTPKGVISRYLYGTSFVVADVEMGLKEAAEGQVRPTISKVLSFCYTYDPEGRTYVLSVTRLAGVLVLIVVAAVALYTLRGRSRKTNRQP